MYACEPHDYVKMLIFNVNSVKIFFVLHSLHEIFACESIQKLCAVNFYIIFFLFFSVE